jgi:hypothetical protein
VGGDSYQKHLLGRAVCAVAHRIAKVIWLVLHQGVEYPERGPALQNPRNLLRKFRRLVREFGRQGMDFKLLLEQEIAATA